MEEVFRYIIQGREEELDGTNKPTTAECGYVKIVHTGWVGLQSLESTVPGRSKTGFHNAVHWVQPHDSLGPQLSSEQALEIQLFIKLDEPVYRLLAVFIGS